MIRATGTPALPPGFRVTSREPGKHESLRPGRHSALLSRTYFDARCLGCGASAHHERRAAGNCLASLGGTGHFARYPGRVLILSFLRFHRQCRVCTCPDASHFPGTCP